jgi:hypothetical protein
LSKFNLDKTSIADENDLYEEDGSVGLVLRGVLFGEEATVLRDHLTALSLSGLKEGP